MKKLFTCLSLYTGVFFSVSLSGAQAQNVTEIITDFQGYWRSGVRPFTNSIAPNASNDLLSFTLGGVRYSTGVNDGILVSKGLEFVPGSYRALPVSTLPAAPSTSTYIGLGQLYDGVSTGASTPAPANNIPFYLTDGINGLNLGTAIYNLPVSNLVFDIGLFNISKIGDGIPDIIVTQVGEIADNIKDTFRFINPSGVQVGNSIAVTFAGADSLGVIDNDFYNAWQTPMGFATNFYPSNTKRAVRVYAFELSDFGLNSSNFGTIDKFVEKLSGQSDQAFVAYNTNTLQILPSSNPGCFANFPGLWLKGDDGTSTITNDHKIYAWEDRSPNTISMQEMNEANRPTFKDASNSFNYNAYFDFNAANKLIGPNSPFTDSSNNADIFIVGRPTNTTPGKNKIIGFSRNALDNTGTGAGDYPSINYNEQGQLTLDSGDVNLVTSTATGNLNTIFLEQINYTQGADASISLFKNGTADGAVNTARSIGRWTFHLGDKTPGNDLSDFDLAEIMVFPKNLGAIERMQVESYLGLKYGLTLSHNYIAGSGVTTWNVTSNAGYNNNIFGIGREDCQAMHRKQSKSVQPQALITIGNVSIAYDNIGNFNQVANGSFEMMGDNGGALTFQSTEVPVDCYQRTGREWKVKETGTIGNVMLRVPASTSTLPVKLPAPSNGKMYLLVDNDGDFSTGMISVAPMVLNGTNWEVSYNFADGNYYTFATDNGTNTDFNDLSTTWPGAHAVINGCNTNGDAVIDRADKNGTRVMAWAGSSVTPEGAALSNPLATGDAADDGLQLPAVITKQEENTFNVVLNTNVSGTTVYYRFWIDWNKDGNFNNDVDGDGVKATYAGSAVVNGTSVTVPVTVIPPASANTDFAIRLIVSAATIANSYNTNSSYVFNITNGEVEDYIIAAAVLPAKLVSFTASAVSCKTLLSWKTASELNTDVFVIERSTDGMVFSPVGSVKAKNLSTGAGYDFTDNAQAAGAYYYRLKIKDKDGHFEYTATLAVNTSCPGRQVSVSPNPASHDVLIKGLEAGGEKIDIVDASGKIVLSYKATPGQYRADISGLADGIYFIRISNGKKLVHREKIIKIP